MVFVSSDSDSHAFDEYFGEMSQFHAIEYSDKTARVCMPILPMVVVVRHCTSQRDLANKFNVSGIPTLVFVDASGKTLSKDGRRIVMDDDSAAGFPWTPKSLHDILGDSFVDNKGKQYGADALTGKVVWHIMLTVCLLQ